MLSRLISYNLDALALLHPPPLPPPTALFILLLHAFGLVLLAQVMGAPLWIAPAALGIFGLAQWIPRAREILSPAVLAPFGFVYLLVALRFLWLRVLRGELPGYFDYTLPDLRVLLGFEFLVTAALLYSTLILVSRVLNSRRQALTVCAVILASAAFAWAAVEYFGHRTYGATGSDPYAYVQMAVDLAARGTASHLFRLFPLVAETSLPWFPMVHVGYHLPYDLEGNAITVWSIAGSLPYALAYLLGGESALYLVNPLFALASVLVSGLLVWELARNESWTARIVIACTTAVLITTSNEIVNWAGATMVDTQALVFSALAFYCAVRVARRGKWAWALSAGICWGIAYFVRHTQLVIGLSFLVLYLFAPPSVPHHFRNLVVTGIAALAVALPDLWYHQTYLGNWLHPESEELALFSLGAVPATLGTLAQSAFVGAEFGWLPPFLVLGMVLYTRHQKITGSALLLWLGAALAIHLPYAALRLRDLIPEFPIAAFYIAYGGAAAVTALWRRERSRTSLAAALLIFLAFELSLVRVWNILPRATQPALPIFGTMTESQRISFNLLAQALPPNALVGASLNSGAIDLYSKRGAFRPADWSSQQLREFISLAYAHNYAIYLLQDSAAMTPIVDDLRRTHQVERVTTLDIPLFGSDPVSNAGALWRITQ